MACQLGMMPVISTTAAFPGRSISSQGVAVPEKSPAPGAIPADPLNSIYLGVAAHNLLDDILQGIGVLFPLAGH